MRVLFDLEEIAVIQRAVNRCFVLGIYDTKYFNLKCSTFYYLSP